MRVRELLERIYGTCLPNHRFRYVCVARSLKVPEALALSKQRLVLDSRRADGRTDESPVGSPGRRSASQAGVNCPWKRSQRHPPNSGRDQRIGSRPTPRVIAQALRATTKSGFQMLPKNFSIRFPGKPSVSPVESLHSRRLHGALGEIRTPDHLVRNSPSIIRESLRRLEHAVVPFLTCIAAALLRAPAVHGRSGQDRSTLRIDQRSGRRRRSTIPRA